jgi:hypothetical protein
MRVSLTAVTPGLGNAVLKQAGSTEAVVEMNRWLLECLDIVISLGAFRQGSTREDPSSEIVALTKPALRRVVAFETLAFLESDRNRLDFPFLHCDPPEAWDILQREIDAKIGAGVFGWALHRNHPVVVGMAAGA